ncbi:GSAP protein, partial [Polypterus senegalus]
MPAKACPPTLRPWDTHDRASPTISNPTSASTIALDQTAIISKQTKITGSNSAKFTIDLDNTQKNEQLKFSVMSRLSETMSQKLYHLWDHPITSAFIAQNYVKTLFANHGSKEEPATTTQWPESGGRWTVLGGVVVEEVVIYFSVNPFEEQENVDAKFVEEFALKNTSIELGFEKK